MKRKNTQTQNSNDKRNVANRIKEIKNHRHNRNTTHYKERLNITKLLHLTKWMMIKRVLLKQNYSKKFMKFRY